MALYPPSPLKDLQNLSEYTTVSCVGGSYPLFKQCSNTINLSDEVYGHAVDKLRNLSKTDLKNHGVGLVDTLKTVARGFSCERPHRPFRGQRERLPYYWIALDILPRFLDCMGLEDPFTGSCSADRETSIRLAVSKLDPGQVWCVDQAINHLNDKWYKNAAVANYFRASLQKRLADDRRNKESREEQERGQERWELWHQSLDATEGVQLDHILDSSPGTQSEDEHGSEDLQDKAWQSDEESEGSLPPGMASTGLPETEMSDRQQRLLNNRSTPQRTIALARPQRRMAPVSAPKVIQTPASRNDTIWTPTGRRRRPSQASSPEMNANSINNSTLKAIRPQATGDRKRRPSRRVSAPHILERPENSQTQHGRTLSVTTTMVEERFRSHVSDVPQRGANSGSEIEMSEDSDLRVPSTAATSLEDLSQYPRFDPSKKPQPVIETTCEIFEEMQKPLQDSVNNDRGHIYALSMPNRPGYIKIGRTTRKINHRIPEIEVCTGGKLELINPKDHCFVANHKRVETLIHKELQPYQRKFLCRQCKSKGKRGCGNTEELLEHGEWFEIDQNKATETISRWREWMESKPYSNRKLRATENLRIIIHQQSKRMDELIKNKDSTTEHGSWDWDNFMRYSAWQLLRIQLEMYLHEDRPERNDISSRWVSLLKHWHFNVIIYVVFFLFSRFMSVVAAFIPSTWGCTFVNSIVLGSIAIMYAA